MKSKKETQTKLKELKLAMLAPSFVADFNYPEIIHELHCLGFDKVVELTFGAKLINKEYHRILSKCEKNNENCLRISSVCPGLVEFIKQMYPQYESSLMKVDSPMIATAKVCKKEYPNHKIVFISPCYAKKKEAEEKGKDIIDEVITYGELVKLLKKSKIKACKNESEHKHKLFFDKFYNDFTKIYPLTGGLSKTAHVKGVMKPEETKIIDGVTNIKKFLDNPDKNIRFLDGNFCIGGCIGGPCLSKERNLAERKKRVLDYLEWASRERIPQKDKGLFDKAKGISFAEE